VYRFFKDVDLLSRLKKKRFLLSVLVFNIPVVIHVPFWYQKLLLSLIILFVPNVYTTSAYGTFFLFQINIAVTVLMTPIHLTMAMICTGLWTTKIAPILRSTLNVHRTVITPSLVPFLPWSTPFTCNVAVYLHFAFDLSIRNMPLTLSVSYLIEKIFMHATEQIGTQEKER
jgi:hypothetical protein